MLQEYEPISKQFTGDEIRMRVTYMTDKFLPAPLVVMSLEKLAEGVAASAAPKADG